MSNKKKISIIIVTYKSQDLLQDCLLSIQIHNDLKSDEIEVIIVDNSPPHDAAIIQQMIEKLKFNFNVHYYKNSNLGYGEGNNKGILKSNARIVAVMNPDVRFSDQILKHVIRRFDESNNLSLLALKQKGGHDLSFFPRPEFKSPFDFITTKIKNKINFFNHRKDAVSGALMFFDKEKFIEVGLFDDRIFMYFEESDICIRLNRKYNIIFDSTKHYTHLIDNRKGMDSKTFEKHQQSLLYYLNKNAFSVDKFLKNYRMEAKIKILLAKLFGNYIKVKQIKEELKITLQVFNLKV